MSRIPSHSEEQGEFPLSQMAEDWLFAYANARNQMARETMWPHLVEAVEELIAESRRMGMQQTKRG
ncbi:MAG: hypothetical protein H7835_05685 [Magnetococcus sp. XQGC-1]